MNKELRKALVDLIMAFILLVVTIILVRSYIKDIEYINQLEQNNIEQAEEKEVYRNRCQELENIIEGTGLVVDNCECN